MNKSIELNSSPLEDQIDLMDKINSILENHSTAGNFKLLFIDDSIKIDSDEVFIQELDSKNRSLIIRPIKICDLAKGQSIHAVNVVDLNDHDFVESMKNEINLDASKVPKCLTSYNPKRHHYD